MKNYYITPITEQHIESYHAAVDSVAKERKYLIFLEGLPLKISRKYVLVNLRRNWPHFVAISEEKVVGWCDITSFNQPAVAHIGQLGIGVLAPYRGQGIGEALIRVALEKAKSIGLTRIELTVREHNKSAIALYEKIGFQTEGFQRNAVRVENAYENHINMAILFE